MYTLRACAVLAPLLLVACGGGGGDDGGNNNGGDGGTDGPGSTVDAKVYMDAPPPAYDFTCEGNTAPTDATATVTMTGKAQKVAPMGLGVTFQNLSGASVKACVAGTTCMGQDVLDTDTTASDGTFTLGPIDTGMTPLDVYITLTEGSSRTTFTYPGQPLVADQANIPVLTFDPGVISALGLFGCSQDDSMKGMVGLAVTDCADTPITDSSNITLTVKQNGTAVSGASVVDLGSISAMAAGTFLVCNVPENDTTEVSGSYKGMALRPHNVKVVKGTTTATVLRPGF